jgi:serine/threonine protein kinase
MSLIRGAQFPTRQRLAALASFPSLPCAHAHQLPRVVSSPSRTYFVDPQPINDVWDKPWLVLRARCVASGTFSDVVLKLAPASAAVAAIFAREVELTQRHRLRGCPGLAAAIDYSLSQMARYVFLVYPYCGVNAAEFIASESFTRSDEAACRLVTDVAAALQFLHSCGLAHRDVKLDNICVRDGHAFLVDLELLLPIGAEYDGVHGTVGYIAPELMGKSRHTVRAENDIYALAWVALQFFAGEVLDWDEMQGFGDPNALLWHVPEGLVEWVRRGIGSAEERRSVGAFLGYLDGLPFSTTESSV